MLDNSKTILEIRNQERTNAEITLYEGRRNDGTAYREIEIYLEEKSGDGMVVWCSLKELEDGIKRAKKKLGIN